MSGHVDEYGLVGTLLADKYRIHAVIGVGGFGVVYRAQHEIWDQPVAVKVFTALSSAPASMRDSLLEGFIQEGKLLSALSSRTAAIVQARDIGSVIAPSGAWLPYMVLEWLEGAPLNSFLRDEQDVPKARKRSAEEVFQLLDGAARALALAHSHGVAHRDIKPDNFFVIGGALESGATIKVLDFGIAKVMQSQAATALATTGSSPTSFTPNYGAPEQFDRRFGATGPWTDVFGLALVFVELMQGGAPPLMGETFMQLAFASQNPNERPTPRGRGLEVPDAVEEVFQTACALNVVDRYKSIGEFWIALAGALGIADYPAMPTADVVIAPGTGGPSGAASKITAHRAATVSTPAVAGAPSTGTLAYVNSPTGAAAGVATSSKGVTQVSGADTSPPGLAPSAAPPARNMAPLIAVGGLVALLVVGVGVYLASAGDEPQPVEDVPKVAEKVAEEPEASGGDEAASEGDADAEAPPCPEDMRLITGGKFFMGSDDLERSALLMARPAHQVEVADYCIDEREVTVAAYQDCSERGECKRAFRDSFWPRPGSTKKADWKKQREIFSELCNEGVEDRAQHPINCVTWAQADHYCKTQGKRLPSEAEWEFAARGSDGRVFPWGDEPPTEQHANVCGAECLRWRGEKGLDAVDPLHAGDDDFVGTAPVGSFPSGKTQAGLSDMIGNVFEWTADSFAPYEGAAEPLTKMDFKGKRVIRGGAFNSSEPAHADPALRYPQAAETHTHAIGFRCAADPTRG